jgi:two-component system, OmpR family, response regulator MprA
MPPSGVGPESGASVSAPAPSEAPSAPRRVLIVDPDPECRAALQQSLRAAGIEVEAAGDGPRGVQRALAWRPDAALLALRLPRLNGIEVARHLRAAFGEAILLIALTAGDPGDRELAALGGFDVYMTSREDLKELFHVVAGVASKAALPNP